jgi:hypothetical protein
MTDEQYSSECECDPFAAILGAYYGKDIAACEAEGELSLNLGDGRGQAAAA